MSFRNERLAMGFLSLDKLSDHIDIAKSRVLSDQGEGAERICRAIDHEDELDAERELELDNQNFVLLMVAEGLLVLAEREQLVPVLEQIVENGANRQESIWRLSRRWHAKKETARRKYYRDAKSLLTLFSLNEIRGETHAEKLECHTAAQEI